MKRHKKVGLVLSITNGPKPVPKLSFAKKLNEWDWIIGTGIYTDDIDTAITNKATKIRKDISSQIVKVVSIVAVLILLSLIASYFLVGKGVVWHPSGK